MTTIPHTQILSNSPPHPIGSSPWVEAKPSLQSALSKKKTLEKKAGITVKSSPNGDAGIKVSLEFKKADSEGDFTWVELRMQDEDGQHLLSTRLQPHPIANDQPEKIITVSFSAHPTQLDNCFFWLRKGGGLGGEILTIKVSEFLEN